MVQIPTFTAPVEGANAKAEPAHVNPNVAAQPWDRAAQASGELADAMTQWQGRYNDAVRQASAANVMSGASTQADKLQFASAHTPDPSTAPLGPDGNPDMSQAFPTRAYSQQLFAQGATALKAQTLAGVKDPLISQYVSGQIDHELAQRHALTGDDAWQLESSGRVGALDTRLAGYAQQASSATSSEMRQTILDRANGDIVGTGMGGWMKPDQVALRKITFQDRIAKDQATNWAMQVSQGPHPMDPISIANAIRDPNSDVSRTVFPGMQPATRDALSEQQLRVARAQIAVQTGAQAHADAVAERALRQNQSNNEVQLLDQIYKGQPPDMTTIDHLAQTHQISPSGMEAIHAATTRQTEGTDDPKFALNLYQSLERGENISDQVNSGLSAGRLSKTTAIGLAKANAAQLGKEFQDPIAKTDFARLKTVMNGAAIDNGTAFLATQKAEDKAAQTSLWAQAQGEWAHRTLIGKEDPDTVLADMLPRYQKTPEIPAAWPTPKFGLVNSMKDVAAVAAKTKSAFEAGQIDKATYDREGGVLSNYQRYYQSLPPPAAAPKGGGGVSRVTDTSGSGEQ